MASPQRAGKLAPRLVQDILLYDPAHPPETGRNLLSEVPPVYTEHHTGPQGYISLAACRHNYVTKTSQTLLADPEHRKKPGMTSKVAVVCSKCRCHLQVVVNYRIGLDSFTQNKSDHVHHLVYKSGRQKGDASTEEVTSKGQVAETFHFECSYLSCRAIVSLRILSPILNTKFVHLLTDPESLRKRAEEAITADPPRLEGMAIPQPITALDNLRQYLSNALDDVQPSRGITSNNKRFMLSFGVKGAPCKELLEFLEFTHLQDEGVWKPPKPDNSGEMPYHDTLSIFLDDVVHELVSLMESRPLSEKKGFHIPALPTQAENNLFYALEAVNYPKSLRANVFEMPPAPFYEDLGAVEDMASSLIVEAFHRQVSVDPARASLYLNCLKSIGTLRKGEDWEIIDQAVQVAYAEGKYTNDDVVDAYIYFGLRHDDPNLTDESIVGTFYARLSSTSQETEARQQLWRIGHSRGSERIQSASEDRVFTQFPLIQSCFQFPEPAFATDPLMLIDSQGISTVEQAHVFLGVDDQTPDDFVITMYTAKVNDSPSSRDLANHAVRLIAESRKSVALNHFINTGETVAGEMDVGDAYRLLQIPDRTADEGAIGAAYTICVDENPEQKEKYTQALTIIAKEMDNAVLKALAGVTTEPDVHRADWPVGLQNIGNTCYLNSLLQFYFSVRPFREMVLYFETFQMDLNDQESLNQKQVGSRKVLKTEVERSQRFLGELRTLFNSMITSPLLAVTPGQELARLTLISPGNEAAIRRRSTISASRPQALGEIDGAPILGPLGPPQSIKDQIDQPSADDAPNPAPAKDSIVSDVDSEATLVSESNRNDAPAEDKENEPPLYVGEPASEADVKPDASSDHTSKPEMPNRPPPVPPRPSSEADRQKQLIEEVEIGAQQDVTEVINNVLFQSQCAIKPEEVHKDGEQIDQIKHLFYGRTKSYISSQGSTRSKEEWWCDIKVDVASGSRDIYAALDGAFDVQQINVENAMAEQFASISRLPPILQIQVQRVQFDPVKKSSFKSTHHLELLETIFLDRYMDTQKPEVVNRRRQCWEWKNTLKSLEARRSDLLRKEDNDGADMPSLLRNAKETLQDLGTIDDDLGEAIKVDSDLFGELDKHSQTAENELHAIEQEIKHTQNKISSQFADYRNLAYRLYAVFVHHGSVSFGHYYIYIRDFGKNMWRKYNDEYVTEVQNEDDIFRSDDTQNPPTPYFLVYVIDERKDRMVDPVCRDIDESMPDQLDTQTTTTTATQGVHAMKESEDEVMDDPPPYHEASAQDKPADAGAGFVGDDASANRSKRKRV